MVCIRTITVEEYNRNPPAFNIIHGYPETPFGRCHLAVTDTDEAITLLTFVPVTNSQNLVKREAELQRLWPKTELLRDEDETTVRAAARIFHGKDDDSVSVLLKGTEFQISVWLSLLDIPPGTMITYEEIARNIGNPKAVRAVGNAIMQNKVGYLLPCHRVKGRTRSNKYNWGLELKQRILEHESKQN